MLTEKEFYILLLRHQGLTQIDVADHLKITQGVVSRTEASARRKIISAQTDLARLSRVGIIITPPQDRDQELVARAKRRKP